MGGDELASERELVALELCRHDRLTPDAGGSSSVATSWANPSGPRARARCRRRPGRPARPRRRASRARRAAITGRPLAEQLGGPPSSCSRSRSPNSPRSLPSTPSALASAARACALPRSRPPATRPPARRSPYCAECVEELRRSLVHLQRLRRRRPARAASRRARPPLPRRCRSAAPLYRPPSCSAIG